MSKDDISRRIGIIQRCGRQYRSSKLCALGLTSPHSLFIKTISHNPGISQEELAGMICMDKSSVARHLASLEELGLVERRQCSQDKRIVRVYPSAKMLELLPQVEEIIGKWNEYLLDGLDEGEREIFVSVLEKVAERAKNYSAPSSSARGGGCGGKKGDCQ